MIGNAWTRPDIALVAEKPSRMAGCVGLLRQIVSEWIPMVRRSAGNSLIKPKDEGISVDPGLADAHWHMGQVENQAR